MTPKTRLLAIVAIVLVIVIAAAAVLMGGNGSNQGTPAATREASNAQMAVKVLGIADLSTGAASPVPEYFPADNGTHYVVLNVSLQNKMDEPGSAPALLWDLYTSDGQVHSITFFVQNNVPDGVQAKGTATFYLPYQISNGTTPTKLVYNGASTLEINL
jgi:hypothetical protein